MANVIQQGVVLPASPDRLYQMYLDPVIHAAMTGGPAQVGEAAGSPFSAFGGQLRGQILQTVPGRLIVQSWRSDDWKVDALDSTLILRFSADPEGGRIELVHVNVPDHDYEGVTEGWDTYYWTPWRAHLAPEEHA